MNNEYEGIGKVAVIARSGVLSQNLAKGAEENHEKSHSGEPVSPAGIHEYNSTELPLG
jgi:hypothetical protein